MDYKIKYNKYNSKNSTCDTYKNSTSSQLALLYKSKYYKYKNKYYSSSY